MLPYWATLLAVAISVQLSPAVSLWSHEHFSLFKTYFENIRVGSLNIYACSFDEALRAGQFLSTVSSLKLKLTAPNCQKPLATRSTPYVQGVVLDLQCYNASIDWTNEMFNTSYSWMVLINQWDDLRVLEESRLNFLSDVVVANCSEGSCSLYEVYRIRESHPLKTQKLGSWLNMKLDAKKKSDKTDLEGTTIAGGVVVNDIDNKLEVPPNLEDRTVYAGRASFTRYHLVLYRHLEILYNFKVVLVRSATYGYPKPDGSYDGLVGDVSSNRVDIGLTAIEPREGRAELVNFLLPLWKIRLVCLLRQPRALGSFTALALPLSQEVWALILLFAVVFAACFYTIQRSLNQERSLSEGAVLVVGVLSQQGLTSDVDRTSGRVLCFFLLLLSLILMSYYNAAIMNALLLPSPVSIKYLRQLLAPTSPVQPGFLNITYLVNNKSSYKYVSPSTGKAVKRTPNYIMELKPGIQRVKESNFAFCAEDIPLYDEVERTFDDSQKCDLSEVELLKPFWLSGPIAKTSPFKDIITRGLIYLRENGLVSRAKAQWKNQAPQCLGSISFIYVSLKAVGISFAIFLTGAFLSLVTFALECAYKYKLNKSVAMTRKEMS